MVRLGRVVTLAGTLASCGGDDASAPDPLARFVGTWTAEGGTQDICGSVLPLPEGAFRIRLAASTGGLLQYEDALDCRLLLRVSEDEAALVADAMLDGSEFGTERCSGALALNLSLLDSGRLWAEFVSDTGGCARRTEAFMARATE